MDVTKKVHELKKEAKERKIKHYPKMNDEQLYTALGCPYEKRASPNKK